MAFEGNPSQKTTTKKQTKYFLEKSVSFVIEILILKSVHFQKPVTRSSFLSKSVVIFNITITNMTTLFERNEDRVTGFLK